VSDRQLTDGSPVPDDDSHKMLRADGQQQGYVVLTPEERAKGFVKPVRRNYLHVGPPALPSKLRDLTDEEHAQYDKFGYVKFEHYGGLDNLVGKYWTQKEIDRAGKRCGSVTTMGTALAETYARDPRFYSGTFCCACGQHFPLNEFTWEPDGEPMDPRLQDAWHAEREPRIARENEERRQRRITELKRELAELERSAS
jgi:hypothetical protein